MTTRNMTAAAITAATSQSGVTEGHLITIPLSSSSLNLTTGTGDVVYSGSTYTALGGTLTLGPIVESPDNMPTFTINFSGVDTTVLSAVFTDYTIGRQITVRQYYMVNGQFQGDAFIIAKAYMNGAWTHTRDDKNGRESLSTSCTSRLVIGNQVSGIRTNLTSHQKYYPNDTFYKWTVNIANQQGIVIPGRHDEALAAITRAIRHIR